MLNSFSKALPIPFLYKHFPCKFLSLQNGRMSSASLWFQLP